MRLSSVFSNGAVFQQNAVTDFRGIAEPNTSVTATLIRSEKTVATSETLTDENGRFTLSLLGPEASFTPYSIVFSCKEERLVLNDVLFGEVWLALGQSNMVLKNFLMDEHDVLLDEAATLPIRYYRYQRIMDTEGYNGGGFPFEAQEDAPGAWYPATDRAAMEQASALSSSAAVVLAEAFRKEGKEIPVAFLDMCLGGTPIEAWLPSSIVEDEALRPRIVKYRHYTSKELRNQKAVNQAGLHRQQSVLYNGIIAPIVGVKARGVLWYQGEDNVSDDIEVRDYYASLLEAHHAHYESLFSSDKSNPFPMLCSTLFPCTYGKDATVRRANIDLAIVNTARKHPDWCSAIPNYDLPPRWSYPYLFDVIHPTNKYQLGARFAEQMLVRAYGKKGIPSAATLKKTVRRRGELELHFDTKGFKLTAKGTPRGFYICGKNGVYMPADVRVISPSRLILSHPHLPSPKHACYQMADMQNDGNLYCGTLPLAPFATDLDGRLAVPQKRWLFSDTDAQFTRLSSGTMNAYVYPLRLPLADCALAYDPSCRSVEGEVGAVRILNHKGGTHCGFTVAASEAEPLDLGAYRALTFPLFCQKAVTGELCFLLQEENGTREHRVPLTVTPTASNGCLSAEASFRLPREATVLSLTFLFSTEKLHAPTVALGHITLIPKRS